MAGPTTTKTPEAPEQTQEKSIPEQARAMMEDRLGFLRPLREEADEIERMLNAIQAAQNGQVETPAASPSPAPARSARSGSKEPTGKAKAVLDAVREHPGESVSQIGDRLGYTQKNYLYRVVNNLTKDGLLRKEGKALVAVEA